MTSPERKIIPLGDQEFQPVIKYKDFAKSPAMIVKQTCLLIDLSLQGVTIPKSDMMKDYLQDYTLFYLRKAEKGVDTIYDRKEAVFKDLDLETKEAAHHAFIIFAHLPDNMTSRFLPNGFSRRGMLKAPVTKDEFLSKIEEIKIGLWQILDGKMQPQTTLEAYPRFLRTYGFFKVGSNLPMKMSEDEKKKEQIEREKFEDILKDIKISL